MSDLVRQRNTMHIVLTLLGAIVTILVLLSRLADAGISLGGLNPFLWKRRRKWQNRLEENPIYHVEDPMEAAALLVTAAAHMDGGISREDKVFILSAFEGMFHLDKKEAASLLISSQYLLGKNEVNIDWKLQEILNPSLPNFTQAQADSTIDMLQQLCADDSTDDNPQRRELVKNASEILSTHFKPDREWGSGSNA